STLLHAFEFDVILIRHEVGRDHDAAFRQNRAELALRERRLLLPRPHVIVRLPGDVHAHERKLFWLNDCLGTFLCRRESAQRQNENESDDETKRAHQLLFGSADAGLLAGCSFRFCSTPTLYRVLILSRADSTSFGSS